MTHLKHAELKDMIDFADNDVNKKILAQNNDSKAMLVAIKKDQLLGEHSSPVDAFLYVIEGEIEFSYTQEPDEDYIVKKGEVLFFPRDKKHKVYGKKDSKMLVIKI